MKSNHTSEPWIHENGFTYVLTEKGQLIADCSGARYGHLPLEEKVANAKLIGTVPYLLKAAEENDKMKEVMQQLLSILSKFDDQLGGVDRVYVENQRLKYLK